MEHPDGESSEARILVHNFADQLRQYATHFEMTDWAYTRRHDIKHIRKVGDWSGYDHPLRRLRRALGAWVDKPSSWERDLIGKRNLLYRVARTRIALRGDRHIPDGVLDGGGVIAYWEETGEYLQYVQPSVGALLADLMDANPTLPHVRAIAAEMKRINDDYGKRVAAEADERPGGDDV